MGKGTNNKTLSELNHMAKKLMEVNRKLQESEATRNHFISNIKNEMNNPLTSIMGLSRQLLTDREMNAEKITTIASFIYSEAFDLDFQLRNIFAAAEIEAGDGELCVSNVDVGALIFSVMDSFKHMADEKSLNISCETSFEPGRELFFKTDIEKLHLILTNLLCNAIEFSTSESAIKILAWAENGRLSLIVKDIGIGIDASNKDNIFGRFRQLDSGTKKAHKGHGIGLSVTKALIDILEGTISLSSSREAGTVFSITLPATESDIEAEMHAVDGNVFVFDDEEVY